MSDHHQNNVGALDATLRILLGIPILIAGFVLTVNLPPDWGAVTLPVLAIVGGTLIVTGSLRIDPMYALVDVNTVRKSK